MPRKLKTTENARPLAPAQFGMSVDGPVITPARGLRDWILRTFVEEGGPLFNEDHRHLLWANFECLWAAGSFEKQGRSVIGQCEEVAFRVSGWPRWRQEQQLREWFGQIPDYLITLDASFCRDAGDVDFCALVEHELSHIGHKTDEFGAPAFTEEGMPKLFIRDHDVTEFVGVVRRYGAVGLNVAALVEAANAGPTVGVAQLRSACGTCRGGA